MINVHEKWYNLNMKFKTYYLEKSDRNSHDFYELIIDDLYVTGVYGRIGTKGRHFIKEFKSEEDIWRFSEEKIRQRIEKGYAFKEKGKTLPRTKFYHPKQIPFPFLKKVLGN